MCCFSGKVEHVESTKIFARRSAPGRQVLVYQMKLAAKKPVAMILPIPVPGFTADDAVRFVSLEGYPELFTDMARAFPVPAARGDVFSLSRGPAPAPLVVHSVGAFVASFVPTLADFKRLDKQFRVPKGTIDRVPEYADWGFAVFQLALTAGALSEVHPMAFDFPTRRPDALFFPTVHVHDGALHPEAAFAHTLYAQGLPATATEWWTVPLAGQVDPQRAQGLVDTTGTISMRSLYGSHPNRDIWA